MNKVEIICIKRIGFHFNYRYLFSEYVNLCVNKKKCLNIVNIYKGQSFLNTCFSVIFFNILNLYCLRILNSTQYLI